ncbi:glycosyltransferase family A protein [Kitasatospora sp. NPDC094015]|uniref:glycosyltransferase family 2 protein n=1 Tax=Kitasatospora sp. NPDC094015 TaxID=3155205 RepID=UPI0033296B5C
MTNTPSPLPRISCVILCHNYGRYLDRAITSCLEQQPGQYTLHEILVIDDGSTDDTPEVCRRHQDYVRVVRRPQRGFAQTLSDAVILSEGDWIAPLDADDWFHPAKLRTCAAAITPGRLLIDHWETVVGVDGLPLLPEPHPGGNTSTLLVRRDAARTLLPVTNEIHFHALRDAGHGHTLTEPLVNYRLHPASMTDRTLNGASQHYRADVCADLAHRLVALTATPPTWATAATLRRIARRYRARSAGHRVEAHLQQGHRLHALRPLTAMLYHSLRGRAPFTAWLRTLASVARDRPLAPPPPAVATAAAPTIPLPLGQSGM